MLKCKISASTKGTNSVTMIAIIVPSVVGGLLLIVVIIFIVLRKKQKQGFQLSSIEMSSTYSPPSISNSVDSTIARSSASRYSIKPAEEIREVQDIEIKERLGGGFFSDVFRGVWEKTTPVALKKLKLASAMEEFLREATLLEY